MTKEKEEKTNNYLKKTIIHFFLILVTILGIFSIRFTNIKFEKSYQLFKQEEQYKMKVIILSNATQKPYKDVYQVEVREINGKKVQNMRCILNVKQKKGYIREILNYGDVIEITGNIEIPDLARNYKGFDYQKYLRSKKIYGTINMNSSNFRVLGKKQKIRIEDAFYIVASDIKQRIKQILPQDVSGLCLGILIGEKNEIEEETKEQFQESNLTHMIAVSGVHLSYLMLGITKMREKARKESTKVFYDDSDSIFYGTNWFYPINCKSRNYEYHGNTF